MADTITDFATRVGQLIKANRGQKGDKGDPGPYGGTEVTDPQVAQLLTTGPQTAPLLASKVGKGELVFNAADYGATPSAASDQAPALNAANTAAAAAGARLFVPAGTYRIDTLVTFTAGLDAGLATFHYYGTGTAVRVGQTSGVVMHRSYSLPSVYYKTGTVWGTDTVGIEISNLNTCKVYHPGRIQGFHYAYRFIGYGTGFAYNEVHLGYSDMNRVSYHLTQDEAGWCNENNFYGGRIQMVPGWGAFPDDPGAHYLLIEKKSTTIGGPNNNRFFGCCFEGNNFAYYRVKGVGARNNAFYNCRWETYGSTYRVLWSEGSGLNVIHYGYDAWKVIVESDASSSGNILWDGVGAKAHAKAHSAQAIPTGVDTTLNGWLSTSLLRATYSSATGKFKPAAGEWKIDATILFAANGTGKRTAFLAVGEPGGTVNRVSFDERQAGATGLTALKLSGRWRFNGAEEFWIVVNQNSGADLPVYHFTGNTTLYADMMQV